MTGNVDGLNWDWIKMYKCCKCGGECDGNLGTDPICVKCARKYYPEFMKSLDKMFDHDR